MTVKAEEIYLNDHYQFFFSFLGAALFSFTVIMRAIASTIIVMSNIFVVFTVNLDPGKKNNEYK